MRADPLRTLLEIRRLNVEAAKQGLAQALSAESIATTASVRAETRISEEAEAATAGSAGDDAVEAFARWLPVGRDQAKRARLDADRAAQEVGLARSALILARSDEEAVRSALRDAERTAERLLNRRAQDELDEAGARCRPGS